LRLKLVQCILIVLDHKIVYDLCLALDNLVPCLRLAARGLEDVASLIGPGRPLVLDPPVESLAVI
jgi:hypothetical protein